MKYNKAEGNDILKPIILISHKYYENDGVFGIKREYGKAIARAGGIPLTDASGSIDDYVEMCQGILLTGGRDIEPRRYGKANTVEFNRELDEREFALFNKFCNKNKPIFGICRGEQLINAALGGTLFADIGVGHLNGVTHKVKTKENTLISSLVGENIETNSYHHQSVEKCAPGIIASAFADDGTIEAIEHNEKPIFGVQWHPERLNDSASEKIFGHFISLCGLMMKR